MIRKVMAGALACGLAVTLGSSNGFAADYQGAAVSGGGSISGVVKYAGAPKDIKINLKNEKNAEFCSKHPEAKAGERVDHKILAAGGNLQNAIVFIDGIEKGKEWKKSLTKFDFKDCDVFPKVAAVRKSAKDEKEGNAAIENHDTDILHNPHGYSAVGASRATLFNKPLPSKGSIAEVSGSMNRFKEGKDVHFFLQCDQHNFMEADARIVYNPYYALTGADGAFKLDEIPAGKYKVVAWHPYAGTATSEITVAGGADAKANFDLK